MTVKLSYTDQQAMFVFLSWESAVRNHFYGIHCFRISRKGVVPKLKKYDELTHSIEYEKHRCEKCQMFKSATDFTDKPVNLMFLL